MSSCVLPYFPKGWYLEWSYPKSLFSSVIIKECKTFNYLIVWLSKIGHNVWRNGKLVWESALVNVYRMETFLLLLFEGERRYFFSTCFLHLSCMKYLPGCSAPKGFSLLYESMTNWQQQDFTVLLETSSWLSWILTVPPPISFYLNTIGSFTTSLCCLVLIFPPLGPEIPTRSFKHLSSCKMQPWLYM